MKITQLVCKLSPSSGGVWGGPISAFHPKADYYFPDWQVFWLRVYFNAFPLYKTVAKIEASLTTLLERGLGWPFTATGIAPESHRTSLLTPTIRIGDQYGANVGNAVLTSGIVTHIRESR